MGAENGMKWWQLSLFGIGGIVGTGFFLGSSIGIKMGGPSVLFAFLLAGIGTYIVYDGLAKMTAANPLKGSFRSYAKHAFGQSAGFGVGWMYWSSEMLIMGSQLTALSLFSKFWFPNIPIWIFAIIYAVLGVAVLLAGVKGINRFENIFAVLKLSAIVMFIVIACAVLFGWIKGAGNRTPIDSLFPNGIKGIWSSQIFAFYAFGGIEVMGLMAAQLKNPKDAPKAGKLMLFSLVVIYLVSILLAILLVPRNDFSPDESPFTTALSLFDFTLISHVFNGVLIIAGFSTMVAALFGVTSILVSLAEDGDAPALFAKKGKLSIPLPALALLVAGLISSIITAILLPDKIYEYITTGAGLLLLYNWFIILMSARKLTKHSFINRVKYIIGMALILFGVSGTLLEVSNRIGFFISIGFVGTITLITLLMNFFWKKEENSKNVGSLFKKLN
jgi:L-asparagine transporter-like permease